MVFITVGLIFLLMAFACHWIAGAVLSIIYILCLMLPIEGYKEREEIEQIELLKLKMGSKKSDFYLEFVEENKVVFAYDNSEMYELDGIAYEEGFKKGNIKIYESEFCEEPLLKTFVTEPERGIFTFAPFSTKREYVFYVPEGTVINHKDKVLHKVDVELV